MTDKNRQKWGLAVLFGLGLAFGAIAQICESNFAEAEAELKATVKANASSKFEHFSGQK